MAAEIKSHCRKDVCTIKYKMPAIIIVKSDSKEVCLRVDRDDKKGNRAASGVEVFVLCSRR